MQLSQYFLPLLKETPSEAQVISHRLMLRAGMIRQQSAGIYSWLPLGLKLLKNIEKIVRKNMDQAGCQELLMPCIQPASLWKESGRYDAYGPEMLRIKDRHENELLFGPTNEEIIHDIFKHSIKTYKDLPKILYHIQWKFRDEMRPRFGVMRGREFLMKDAYSFDLTEENALKTYDKIFAAYYNAFRDMGLMVIPVKADAGPIGGDYSHEFHVVADTGESDIYYDQRFEILANDSAVSVEALKNTYAAADEKHDKNCDIKGQNILQRKGIEVGHIFYYAQKYTESMNISVQDNIGGLTKPYGGCYGIGISRLVAAIIESSHDDRGIIWPEAVAPFKVSIINLAPDDAAAVAESYRIYAALLADGIDVLYDDTSERAGSKFAINDLIGTPWQVIVGKKKLAEDLVELKHRKTGLIEDLKPDVAIKKLMALFGC